MISGRFVWLQVLLASLFLLTPPLFAQDESIVIRVGSKKFTESVVLGEMIRFLAESENYSSEHQRELGGTRILWGALMAGEIDVYAEYTGTLLQEILVNENLSTLDQLKQSLSDKGLRMTASLGFNNTYAMAVTQQLAE